MVSLQNGVNYLHTGELVNSLWNGKYLGGPSQSVKENLFALFRCLSGRGGRVARMCVSRVAQC